MMNYGIVMVVQSVQFYTVGSWRVKFRGILGTSYGKTQWHVANLQTPILRYLDFIGIVVGIKTMQ